MLYQFKDLAFRSFNRRLVTNASVHVLTDAFVVGSRLNDCKTITRISCAGDSTFLLSASAALKYAKSSIILDSDNYKQIIDLAESSYPS